MLPLRFWASPRVPSRVLNITVCCLLGHGVLSKAFGVTACNFQGFGSWCVSSGGVGVTAFWASGCAPSKVSGIRVCPFQGFERHGLLPPKLWFHCMFIHGSGRRAVIFARFWVSGCAPSRVLGVTVCPFKGSGYTMCSLQVSSLWPSASQRTPS